MSVAVQIVEGVLGLAFLGSGVGKLLGAKTYVEGFQRWGYPQWFRSVTGAVEVVGGVAMLAGIGLHWMGPLAGLWLTATMLGAVLTHVRVHDSVAKMAPAVVLLVLALVVVVLGWPSLSQQFV
ncbi:MAG TPA: DoxX family protein [Chloroflexota bacterium]